jgi:hypothetical protein
VIVRFVDIGGIVDHPSLNSFHTYAEELKTPNGERHKT